MENLEFFKKEQKADPSGKQVLTPLVDCFAIVLIYLLMATTFSTNELTTPDGMKLPKATETRSAEDTRAVVEIKNNLIFVNKKLVALPQLADELKKLVSKLGKSDSARLIVQADKSLSYGEMNPVVVAGLLAGFGELQFAVIKEEAL